MKRIIITIDDDGRFVDISTEEVEKETEETVYDPMDELRDKLGLPRIGTERVIGWEYDEKNPEEPKYIDFDPNDHNFTAGRKMTNGYSDKVVLDFNACKNVIETK